VNYKENPSDMECATLDVCAKCGHQYAKDTYPVWTVTGEGHAMGLFVVVAAEDSNEALERASGSTNDWKWVTFEEPVKLDGVYSEKRLVLAVYHWEE